MLSGSVLHLVIVVGKLHATFWPNQKVLLEQHAGSEEVKGFSLDTEEAEIQTTLSDVMNCILHQGSQPVSGGTNDPCAVAETIE